MQDAHHLVDRVAVHRQARVLALGDDAFDFLFVIFEVDADDLVVRDHHVVHRDLLEVENADEHLAVARRDARPGLVHDRAQFLAGQRLQFVVAGAHAEQKQHAVRARNNHWDWIRR